MARDLHHSRGKKNDTPNNHDRPVPPTSGGIILPKMILARKYWAYGTQVDYFDDAKCVGFTRLGHSSRSGGDGLAVIMTNDWQFKTKRMYVGEAHSGEVWTDLLKWCPGQVTINYDGWGEFFTCPRSVSVWVNQNAYQRQFVDKYTLECIF